MSLRSFSKKEHAQITTLGTEFAVAEMLGAGFGFWLDSKWGTSPWLLIIGAIGGFLLGFYMILRAAKQMEKQSLAAKVRKKSE